MSVVNRTLTVFTVLVVTLKVAKQENVRNESLCKKRVSFPRLLRKQVVNFLLDFISSEV